MGVEKEYYTVAEFSEATSISERQLRKMIKRGDLPVKKFSARTTRIHKSALDLPNGDGCNKSAKANAA